MKSQTQTPISRKYVIVYSISGTFSIMKIKFYSKVSIAFASGYFFLCVCVYRLNMMWCCCIWTMNNEHYLSFSVSFGSRKFSWFFFFTSLTFDSFYSNTWNIENNFSALSLSRFALFSGSGHAWVWKMVENREFIWKFVLMSIVKNSVVVISLSTFFLFPGFNCVGMWHKRVAKYGGPLEHCEWDIFIQLTLILVYIWLNLNSLFS